MAGWRWIGGAGWKEMAVCEWIEVEKWTDRHGCMRWMREVDGWVEKHRWMEMDGMTDV